MQTPICVYINSVQLNVAASEVPAALVAAITEPVNVAQAKAANTSLIAGRFEVAADTVTDHQTGLMWLRANLPGGCMNHADFLAACASCRVGGFDDWRAPTLQESNGIVDYTRHGPSINTEAFQGCESAGYWTSTEYAPNASYVWVQHFYDGYAYILSRDNEFFGRAVRRVAPGQ